MGQVAASINRRFEERLAERTRIAQELHDTLLQGFVSASMQVQVATDSLATDSPAKRILNRAVQLMGQMIEEGRNAVQGLRQTNSESSSLEQAFATIQEEFEAGSQRREVQFRVLAEGQRRPLHPLIRDEFYRIGREALTNAFRHANANHIDLELKYGPKQFRLLVRDDGRGIEPGILEKGRSGHWGLSGMRERAERVGARLHVFSRASAGTEIELSVPARVAFQDESGGILHWFRKRGYLAKLRSLFGLQRAEEADFPLSHADNRHTRDFPTSTSVTREVQTSDDE
jgi:signal transduction histidine kinase